MSYQPPLSLFVGAFVLMFTGDKCPTTPSLLPPKKNFIHARIVLKTEHGWLSRKCPKPKLNRQIDRQTWRQKSSKINRNDVRMSNSLSYIMNQLESHVLILFRFLSTLMVVSVTPVLIKTINTTPPPPSSLQFFKFE